MASSCTSHQGFLQELGSQPLKRSFSGGGPTIPPPGNIPSTPKSAYSASASATCSVDEEEASTSKKMSKHVPHTRGSFCIDMPSVSLALAMEIAMPPEEEAYTRPDPQNVKPSHDVNARPLNFGTVIPSIYRSSYPQEHNYVFLKNLGLKSVVTLVQNEMPHTYKPFLTQNGITHHVFDMKGTKKESIPLDTMRDILSVVLDRKHHPLLIHCNHGKHRTGCVVGVIRKISGWNVSKIHQEYKSYADPKARETDLEYLADFNVARLSNIFPQPQVAIYFRPTSRMMRRLIFAAAVILLVTLTMCLVTGGQKSPRRTS